MKLPPSTLRMAALFAFLSDQGEHLGGHLTRILKESGIGWSVTEGAVKAFWYHARHDLQAWFEQNFRQPLPVDNTALLELLNQTLFVEIEPEEIPLEKWLGCRVSGGESALYPVILKMGERHWSLWPWLVALPSPTHGMGDIRHFRRCHDDRVFYQSLLDSTEWPMEAANVLSALAHRMLRYRLSDVAVYLYRVLQRRYPDGPYRNRLFAALCQLGVDHYHHGQYPAAARVFEEALSIRTDLAQVHHNLAMTYLKMGLFDRARSTLADAIQEQGPNPRAYEILGDLAVREQDYRQAIFFYERVLELDPDRKGVGEKIRRLKALPYGERQKPSGNEGEESKEERTSALPEGVLVPFSLENLTPVIGRDRAVQQVLEILNGHYKPSVLIVGEPGVGKTALLREALRRLQRMNPAVEIVQLKVGALVAGAKYRGQLEERVQKLSAYLTSRPVILVIEDLHQMVPSATSRAIAQETTVLLREQLLDGSIRVAATTTPDEFRNVIEKDAGVYRCFQVIHLPELNEQTVRSILEHHREHYRTKGYRKAGVAIDPRIIQQIPELVSLYLKGRAMPDRALEVLDRTVTHAVLKGRSDVGVEDLYETIAEMAGVPLAYVRNQALMDWRALRHALRARIIGQDHAIERVLRVLKASTSGLRFHPERPRGVFLFVGPSGVGKTEFAQALAECWMGGPDRLIRIDMSEYMERYSVSRLIGASPGYVGYYDANQLVDRVRQMPFSLILLDEIEKADPQLLQIFLQVFDAGRLTDGRGRTAYFNNTAIIMTSNIGTHLYSREPLGYRGERTAQENEVLREVKKWLPPEFLNRIDDVIVFSPLSTEAARAIVRLKLTHVARQLREQGKILHYDHEAVGWFARHGFHPEYGARYLERTIEKRLVAPLAELRASEKWKQAVGVRMTARDDQLVLEPIIQEEEQAIPEAPTDESMMWSSLEEGEDPEFREKS